MSATLFAINTQQSTHGDLSSPFLLIMSHLTVPYSSLNSLNIFLALDLMVGVSLLSSPFAIIAPVTAPQVPSSKVPPIPPANPQAILHMSACDIGYCAVSHNPISVDSEQLLNSLYVLILSSKISLSSFIYCLQNNNYIIILTKNFKYLLIKM